MDTRLTSKGQLTVPKAARDALALTKGTRMTVEITKDAALKLTPVRVAPLKLYGMLRSPLGRAPTVAQMDAAIGEALAEDDRRIRAQGASAKKPARSRK